MIPSPKPVKQPKAKKKKKPPKLGVVALRKKVWPVFSKWIRARDNYRCYTCGKQMEKGDPGCHAGHYVPQSKGNRLRFDERNVHAQCVSCNSFKRGNLSEYALRLERDYGSGILQEFDRIKNELKHYTREELLSMFEYYTKRLEAL